MTFSPQFTWFCHFHWASYHLTLTCRWAPQPNGQFSACTYFTHGCVSWMNLIVGSTWEKYKFNLPTIHRSMSYFSPVKILMNLISAGEIYFEPFQEWDESFFFHTFNIVASRFLIIHVYLKKIHSSSVHLWSWFSYQAHTSRLVSVPFFSPPGVDFVLVGGAHRLWRSFLFSAAGIIV